MIRILNHQADNVQKNFNSNTQQESLGGGLMSLINW